MAGSMTSVNDITILLTPDGRDYGNKLVAKLGEHPLVTYRLLVLDDPQKKTNKTLTDACVNATVLLLIATGGLVKFMSRRARWFSETLQDVPSTSAIVFILRVDRQDLDEATQASYLRSKWEYHQSGMNDEDVQRVLTKVLGSLHECCREKQKEKVELVKAVGRRNPAVTPSRLPRAASPHQLTSTRARISFSSPQEEYDYDEALSKSVLPLFLRIPAVPLLDHPEISSMLLRPEIEKVYKTEETRGNSDAARLLLNFMKKKPNWFDALINVLDTPDLKLQELKPKFEAERDKVDRDWMRTHHQKSVASSLHFKTPVQVSGSSTSDAHTPRSDFRLSSERDTRNTNGRPIVPRTMSVPDIRRGVKPELEPGSTTKAGPFITLLTVPKQPAVQRRSSPTTSLPRTLDEMSIGGHMAGQTDKERQDVRMEIPARPSVDETSEKQPEQLDLSDDVALRPKLSPESSTSLPGNPTDTRPTTLLRSHTIGPAGHRQLRDRLSEPPSTTIRRNEYCPADQVQLMFEEWFHGVLKRGQADEILQDKRDGSFLVRYSSERGHYVLSFRAKGETIHMKIVESRRSQFGSIVYSLGFGDDFCESIIQLVKHFGQRHDRPPLLHPVRR